MQSRPFFLAPCPPYLGLPAAPPLTQQRDDSRPQFPPLPWPCEIREKRDGTKTNWALISAGNLSVGGASVFGKSDSRQESFVFKDQSFYDSFFIFLLLFLPVLWALVKAQAIKTGWKHNLDSTVRISQKVFFLYRMPTGFLCHFHEGTIWGNSWKTFTNHSLVLKMGTCCPFIGTVTWSVMTQ